MHLKVFGFGATHLYTGKINALGHESFSTSQVHFLSFCASPFIVHPRRNSTENSRCSNAWSVQLGKLVKCHAAYVRSNYWPLYPVPSQHCVAQRHNWAKYRATVPILRRNMYFHCRLDIWYTVEPKWHGYLAIMNSHNRQPHVTVAHVWPFIVIIPVVELWYIMGK